MAVTGFKMKTFPQILASLINWFSSAQDTVTDLNVGSVARTLLEAPASEISEVYFRIFKSIDEAQAEAIYRLRLRPQACDLRGGWDRLLAADDTANAGYHHPDRFSGGGSGQRLVAGDRLQ
jgi:hypothetical protein